MYSLLTTALMFLGATEVLFLFLLLVGVPLLIFLVIRKSRKGGPKNQ